MEADYDWGNLIVQVAIALATIATLAWAILVNRGELRRASVERRERLSFEERAQAARISAWEHQWAEQTNGERLEPIMLEAEHDYSPVTERRRIFVHNGSDAPVYDIAVRYYDSTRPSIDARETNAVWVHAILPPGADARSLEVPMVGGNCGAIAEDFVLEVEFRDASGRYWLRGKSGVLKRRSDLDSLSARDLMARRFMESEGLPADSEMPG